MSLINQMLKDLEQRQSVASHIDGSVLADLDPVSGGFVEPRQSVHWFAMPVLLGAAVVGAAYLAPLGMGRELLRAQVEYRPLDDLVLELVAARDDAGMDASLVPVAAAPAADRPALRLSAVLTQASAARAPSLLTGELADEAARLNAMLFAHPPAAAAPSADTSDSPRTTEAGETIAPAEALSAATEDKVDKRLQSPAPRTRAQALYRRGVAALRRGDFGRAEAALAESLSIWPQYAKAREILASRLIQRGEHRRALALLEAGLDVSPDESRLAKLYARLQAERGEIEPALAALMTSASSVAADPEHHAFIAALFQRLTQHRDAVARYREVLLHAPDNGIWWMGLGISLEALGEHRDALSAFRRAASSGRVQGAVRRFVDSRVVALSG